MRKSELTREKQRLLWEVLHAWKCCWYPRSRDSLWICGSTQRDWWSVHDRLRKILSESFRKRNVIPLLLQTLDRIKGRLWMEDVFLLLYKWLEAGPPVLVKDQWKSRRPYRGTVPLSYDGAESSKTKSQGSNTSKAYLIFVQNIDFYAGYQRRFFPVSQLLWASLYGFQRFHKWIRMNFQRLENSIFP